MQARKRWRVASFVLGFVIAFALTHLSIDAVADTPSAKSVRKACPAGKVLACRAEIIRLRRALAWQRQRAAERWPGDAAAAILLACHRDGWGFAQCEGARHVAQCESRMSPTSGNGQYLGLFQLSPRHRSDPIVATLGWRDPYAEALHTLRYVDRHGWGEWQCQPTGGLRW